MRTAVWSLDSSQELKGESFPRFSAAPNFESDTHTVRYVDLNGAEPPPVLALDAVGNKLHFVGDVDTYNSINDDSPVIQVVRGHFFLRMCH